MIEARCGENIGGRWPGRGLKQEIGMFFLVGGHPVPPQMKLLTGSQFQPLCEVFLGWERHKGTAFDLRMLSQT